MASKVTIVNGEERQSLAKRQAKAPKWVESIVDKWNEFARFLTDVRAEMRKVVTPSRKEVQATTTVVIVAVFIFGVYFFLVDGIFSYGMNRLLQKLGGIQ
jgi:preprotein translocase subunit SecE